MNSKVIIIAEAGVNHNGSIVLARQLIDSAAMAGADYVKFQTFKAEKLASDKAPKARYQLEQDEDVGQLKMLRRLELESAAHIELQSYCRDKKIGFLSSAFDEESVDLLDQLGVPIFKVPSGEITNKPYLQHIAGKGKPVIISTGMAFMSEIKDALKVLTESGLEKEAITVLHCNTEYPTPMKDVNLKAMLAIKDELGVNVGYSDHTLGIEIPIAAVALGAKVIEKHFTTDRRLSGPDHKASLEPGELKAMVNAIRNVELAIMGDGIKEPSQSELSNINVARKSIHIIQELTAGTVIKPEHLIMKRPGNGISPMDIDKVIGKTLLVDLSVDSFLLWEHLKD